MPFTKLDAGITDSSLWAEPEYVRIVFITILAKKNHKGEIITAYSGLRREANLTEDADGNKFKKAIECLESPDLESRTKGNEGRRIEKIDGGWKVINHKKYRDFSYSSSPSALKQKRYRDRNKKSNALPPLLSLRNGSVSVSVSESVSVSSEEEHEKEMSEFETARLTYPGQKRATETEFVLFKKNSKYKTILPTLINSIKRQMAERKTLSAEKKFIPTWKSFENYILKEGWNEEFMAPLVVKPKQQGQIMSKAELAALADGTYDEGKDYAKNKD